MSRSRPEQRACSYCGRRVTATAEECRWCHSDLREPGRDLTTVPPDTPTPAPAEQGRHRTRNRGIDAAASGRAKRTTALRRRGGHRAQRVRRGCGTRLAGSIVAMVVVTAGLAWTIGRPPAEPATATASSALSLPAAEREALLTRSAAAVEAALTYRWSTFDEDADAALAMMTPTFEKRYRETVATSQQAVKERRLTQSVAVVATGLVGIEGSEAEVLAFVDRSTSERGQDPVIERTRVSVSLVYSAGVWLISNLKLL